MYCLGLILEACGSVCFRDEGLWLQRLGFRVRDCGMYGCTSGAPCCGNSHLRGWFKGCKEFREKHLGVRSLEFRDVKGFLK